MILLTLLNNESNQIKHTQLFFFLSFDNMSSSLPPLPCNIDDGFDVLAVILDFLGPIEKSCTSLKSIGFFNISAIFTFGRLDDRSIGVNVLAVPGIGVGLLYVGSDDLDTD